MINVGWNYYTVIFVSLTKTVQTLHYSVYFFSKIIWQTQINPSYTELWMVTMLHRTDTYINLKWKLTANNLVLSTLNILSVTYP